MLADIKLKNYYLKFIYDAKADIPNYTKQLNEIIKIKKELIDYLTTVENELINLYNINLNKYEIEWIEKKYNPKETLYNIVIKLVTYVEESNLNRTPLIQLVKYCNILRKEHSYIKSIELAKKRSNLKLGEYREYVTKYYNKVHKCCLEGYGYRFGYGIGTYCINRWQMNTKSDNFKNWIDYDATNKKKKELLDAGIKIYNKEDADFYAAKGIPYDGVDYKVYKTDGTYYEFTFIKSTIFHGNLEYQRTEYVNKHYRGLSYTQIADKFCKTLNDIYNLQVDIKYKLNILIYLYPNKYLNFIRNLDETKYKFRENNCQD